MSLIEAMLGRATAGADAILAPDRNALSYDGLKRQVLNTAAALRARGIARNDRVAIVVPNGPEAATSFLGVAAVATSAPLNPAYRTEELEFYLNDLAAKALIVSAELDSPARDVALARGTPVIELAPRGCAGEFTLDGGMGGDPAADLAGPEDVALVLHTSGTTSRPKQVPLTHANVFASAHNIGETLALTAADRCLNIMPLFHIHGLVAAVLSSLNAGGSVVCTPGLRVPQFFDWLEHFRPTWYTAVPTMHHAILSGGGDRVGLSSSSLRFIRSSSSALPRQVLTGLEALFEVPVIEAYGMTEASHQMRSNPLPPRERKVGSVGVPAGPDVAIMDLAGSLLPHGSVGEVVIRGTNVTGGYVSNPEANAAAFTNGWFRTGDQGLMDGEGYLFLHGRLKELINRGGEKISPLEVDEILMDHPSVAQALTFGLPHPTLGEDVAAAVVLKVPGAVTERALRNFVAARLAAFKCPRRIVFLEVIPNGATGKPQRIGLAARLGIEVVHSGEVNHSRVAPRNEVEEILVSIWSEVLKSEAPGVQDDFFEAGGDSIIAAQFVARVCDALAVAYTVPEFFEGPTVADAAACIAPQMQIRM